MVAEVRDAHDQLHQRRRHDRKSGELVIFSTEQSSLAKKKKTFFFGFLNKLSASE
jgi:hypothetical protein